MVIKGDDEVEVLSVDISVKTMRIRCVVAYGCQENSLIEKKNKFWSFIEEEVTGTLGLGLSCSVMEIYGLVRISFRLFYCLL